MTEQSVTTLEPHEKALVLAVNRRTLDETSTRTLVDDVLTLASQRPGVPIVLDLSKVRFAPSVALGALVQLSKSFRFEGRRIALINIDERVRGTIRVAMLHEYLEIHPDLAAVLREPPKK